MVRTCVCPWYCVPWKRKPIRLSPPKRTATQNRAITEPSDSVTCKTTRRNSGPPPSSKARAVRGDSALLMPRMSGLENSTTVRQAA